MTALPHLHDIQPPEPDLSALQARTEAWVQRIVHAPHADEVLDVLRAWEDEVHVVGTWFAWTGIRHSQDAADPDNVERKARADALVPPLESLATRLKAAVLDSPHRAEVEARTGGYLLALWQADRDGHDDALAPDLHREQQLVSAYMAATGTASAELRGQTLGIPALRAFLVDPDRDLRHDAAAALWGWYEAHEDELAGIYEELVSLRDRMARTLGDASHTEMAYRRMHRLGYGPDQVAAFRQEIRRHVLPLVVELRARQAHRLGLGRLMAWDLGLLDVGGNARPQGDPAWQMDRAQELMARLDPELGAFYAMMRRRGLLDLVPRPGKTPGGFCSYLPEGEAPFVFANMNGTADDTRVFTHELGHAFQVWSSRHAAWSDLRWPTYDAAEVHSMSLELLAMPHIDVFFGQDAPRYRRDHLTQALTALPWLAAIDDFQHRVYADPGGDRLAQWRDTEATWMPDVDWGDLALPARGGRYLAVGHVYFQPFYGIDYALAQTCALQLWAVAERDPAEAMRRYKALCARGGEAPFVELVEGAGLQSPFEPGVLAEAVDRARRVLLEEA